MGRYYNSEASVSTDPAAQIVANTQHRLRMENEVDLTNGPYAATVYGLYNDDLWHNPITDGPISLKRIRLHAYIEDLDKLITPLPRPRKFMMIFPSGQTGGLIQDSELDKILALPRFVSTKECENRPRLGERIWVDWLVKPSNDTMEWRDPIYLGPVDCGSPIIYSMPPNRNYAAQAAFDDAANGQVQRQSPIGDKFVFNNAPPGYPNIPMLGLLNVSGLAHLTKTIYVDKELDYSKIKKYDIIPGSTIIKEPTEKTFDTSFVQHHKGNKIFYLPDDIEIKQRKATKLFIIRESGKSYIETYKNIRSNPTMHYNIAMNSVLDGKHKNIQYLFQPNLKDHSVTSKSRLCTIRVNVPYGLVINEKNLFSANSVGCMISSPYDGRYFFGSTATWNPKNSIKKINNSKEFENFKSKLNTWVTDKILPDGSDPFILGPWGLPGLRTGKYADQNAKVSDLSNSHFWSGRLTWSSTGHYFLPTLDQVSALYELITSLLESPPSSNYSWGYAKPTRHKNLLSWSFPAVAGGSSLFSMSHFINTQGYFLESKPAFPWGQVGPMFYKKKDKPQHLWEHGLKQRGEKAIHGIVSYSRWGTDSGPFIEYYILSRKLGLGHMEAWYVSLAMSAETMPKIQKGKGLGPTKVPAFGDVSLNKYLEIGQKMWFKALWYLRKEEAIIPKVPPTYTPDEGAPGGSKTLIIEPRCKF